MKKLLMKCGPMLACILRASTATVAFFNGRIAEQNGRM